MEEYLSLEESQLIAKFAKIDSLYTYYKETKNDKDYKFLSFESLKWRYGLLPGEYVVAPSIYDVRKWYFKEFKVWFEMCHSEDDISKFVCYADCGNGCFSYGLYKGSEEVREFKSSEEALKYSIFKGLEIEESISGFINKLNES